MEWFVKKQECQVVNFSLFGIQNCYMNSNVWMELVMSVFIFLHLFFPSQIFFNPTYYHKGFVNFYVPYLRKHLSRLVEYAHRLKQLHTLIGEPIYLIPDVPEILKTSKILPNLLNFLSLARFLQGHTTTTWLHSDRKDTKIT